MVRKRPVEPAQPTQSPAGGPDQGPLAVLGGGKPHATTRAQELRGQLLACKRGLFAFGMDRDRIEYRVLRGLGARPDEILETLLQGAFGDLPSRTFILAMNLPGNLSPDRLWAILDRYQIHPLSLVLHLDDHRRALRVLRRLGLTDAYSRWIAPWGLHIHDEPDLQALPAGLIINGETRIENCPNLADLGEGLVVTMGTLLVRRCSGLQRLPDGLSTDFNGHITLIDCPQIEHLGGNTSIEGILFVQGCPRFQDQHLVHRHTLDEE